MSFFFLFWSTCKFSTSWTIMFFSSPWQKRQGKKNYPPPPSHPHGGFNPLKGIQDSLGFWIPRRGFRIPGTVFQILGQWNLDFNRKWDSGFLCTGSLIFHFSISGFRIPQAKFLGFRNLDSQPYIEHGSQSYDLYVIQVQRLNWSRLRF